MSEAVITTPPNNKRGQKKGNKYCIKGDITILYASNNNMEIIIDTNCLDEVLQYTWRARCLQGTNYYAVAHCGKQILRMHRLISGLSKDDTMVVDHINGNSLDNRKSNLRVCEQKNNCMNRIANKSKLHSKYKGVYSATHGRTFFSTIQVDGKQKYLGSFADEVSAAKAYDTAAKQLFGEYALLNFPYNE